MQMLFFISTSYFLFFSLIFLLLILMIFRINNIRNQSLGIVIRKMYVEQQRGCPIPSIGGPTLCYQFIKFKTIKFFLDLCRYIFDYFIKIPPLINIIYRII